MYSVARKQLEIEAANLIKRLATSRSPSVAMMILANAANIFASTVRNDPHASYTQEKTADAIADTLISWAKELP